MEYLSLGLIPGVVFVAFSLWGFFLRWSVRNESWYSFPAYMTASLTILVALGFAIVAIVAFSIGANK